MSELTGLIELLGRERGYDDLDFRLDAIERDTIVLWLRVGRVLSSNRTLGAVRMFGDAVDIRFQFCSDVEGVVLTKTLDEAEGLLGIGGEK